MMRPVMAWLQGRNSPLAAPAEASYTRLAGSQLYTPGCEQVNSRLHGKGPTDRLPALFCMHNDSARCSGMARGSASCTRVRAHSPSHVLSSDASVNVPCLQAVTAPVWVKSVEVKVAKGMYPPSAAGCDALQQDIDEIRDICNDDQESCMEHGMLTEDQAAAVCASTARWHAAASAFISEASQHAARVATRGSGGRAGPSTARTTTAAAQPLLLPGARTRPKRSSAGGGAGAGAGGRRSKRRRLR